MRASWRLFADVRVCGSVERGRTDRAQRLYEAVPSQGHVLSTDALDAEAGVYEVTDGGPLA